MPSASLPDAWIARQRVATCAVWRADVATRPAGAWADLGGLHLHTTGLAPVHWNGAHLTATAGLARLPEAAAWFAGRGVPWGLLVPEEFGVEPTGFTHVLDQGVMMRDLAGLPLLPGVPLRWDAPVGDVAGVQSAAFEGELKVVAGFVGPKLVNAACDVAVGYRDGQAVATATGVVSEGVVAVFGVGTLASHRRQGWGAALTLAVLHRARERGADLAYLNPSVLGHRMYASLGFVDGPSWRVWSPA